MITLGLLRGNLLPALRLAAMLALGVGFGVHCADAQNITWTGNTSTDWSTAPNWTSGSVPGSGNGPIIDADTGNQPIYSSGNTTIANLTVGASSASGANTSLTIQSGGNLSANFVRIGNVTGSTGSILVTGTNSTLSTSGSDPLFSPPSPSVVVGLNGTGCITIANGARFIGVFTVGDAPNSSGTVVVDGDNSAITTTGFLTHFNAGLGGASNVTVSNGGNITSLDYLVKGANSQTLVTGSGLSGNSSIINLNLSGNAGRLLMYGNSTGTESLTLSNGGQLYAPGGTTINGTTTTVLVTGNGSSFTTGYVPIYNGLGAFDSGFYILNGANVTVANGATLTSNQSTLGSNGTATVTITDAGSTWNETGNLVINTNSTLTLANGGTVAMTNATMFVNGTLNLNSGSVLQFGSTHGNLTGTGNMSFGGGTLQNTFNGTGVGVKAVLIPGTAGAIFDTNGHDFTYGNISGSGNLTKIGAGTLTLPLNTLYTSNGTLTVNAGTMIITSFFANFTGNIVDNGNLVIANAALTYPGIVSGNGNLTVSNSNVSFSGASNFTGNITTNGSNTNSLIFTGDTSQLNCNFTPTGLLAFNQSFDSSFPGNISTTRGSIAKSGSGNLTISGNISGTPTMSTANGSLILTGNTSGIQGGLLYVTSTIIFDQAADNSFSQVIQGIGNLVQSGQDTLTINRTAGYQGSTTISSGTLVFANEAELAGNISNNGTLVFGTNSSGAISGVISGTGALAVNGTPAGVALLGNNTYTGPTSVTGGVLDVDGSLAAASNVTVNSGGTLTGMGSVPGVIAINSGGEITPGESGNGTLTVSNLTLASGTTANIAVADSGNYCRLAVTGALAYGGNLTLTLDNSLKAGAYNLFSAGSRSGDFDGVALAGLFTGSLSDSGGVWAGTTASANFSLNLATGQLTVSVNFPPGTSATRQTWLQNNFIITDIFDSSVSGDSANPSGDGIPNLVKYAFNLNPWTDGHASLPQPTVSNGNLVLTFTAPPADLAYTVEASTDLVNWSTNNVTVVGNGNQITATDPLPASGGAFLRIDLTPEP